jgi:hypothetical protein
MKTKITIQIKPTEAMRAMARREAAFQKERESMYEEMREGRIK